MMIQGDRSHIWTPPKTFETYQNVCTDTSPPLPDCEVNFLKMFTCIDVNGVRDGEVSYTGDLAANPPVLHAQCSFRCDSVADLGTAGNVDENYSLCVSTAKAAAEAIR